MFRPNYLSLSGLLIVADACVLAPLRTRVFGRRHGPLRSRATALRRAVILSACVVALAIALRSPVMAQIVADNSYAAIPAADVSLTTKRVGPEFDPSRTVLFADLKAGPGGYCGFVNATLDHAGFIPFFFDRLHDRVQLGVSGKLTRAAIEQLTACR